MPFSFPQPDQLSHLEQYDDPSETPYPGIPVDRRTCRLMGPTALVVQALMGTLVLTSLIFKRQREKPMRPWRIWLFDVSKQILGQAFVHGLNLLISDIVAHVAQGNPCDLYFLNVLLDTTLGVGYIYLVLHGANLLFTRRLNLKGFQSGEYGDPPSFGYWARQAIVYVLTILTMKLLVVGLFAAWPGIFDMGEWLLGWTDGNVRLQVIFVMGIFPIIMNVLQFWLIDSIVKASASSIRASTVTDDAAHEPLFRDPESEDDEDDEIIRARRRTDIESPPTPQIQHSGSLSEHKSTPPSSSSTRALEVSSIRLHAYPPEVSSSSPSNTAALSMSPSSLSSSSSSVSSFRSKKSRRRSPPPPILRPPPHYLDHASYTISMTPSPVPIRRSPQRSLSTSTTVTPPQPQPRQRHRAAQSHEISRVNSPEAQDLWDDWAEGDGNDWAEKVGEEDWTGRRIGATKAVIDAWGSKGSPTVVVS